jgi:hypothetical protein
MPLSPVSTANGRNRSLPPELSRIRPSSRITKKFVGNAYDPLLSSFWEFRRGDRPVADDIPTIHKVSHPIFESLLPQATVFIHGSFARALQTESSDINLFLPSVSRRELDTAWANSLLRKPTFEDPSVQQSINEHLRDGLGRDVSICCSDDPWLWAAAELKYQIFPILATGYPSKSSTAPDRRNHVLNLLRKGRYCILSLEAGQVTTAQQHDHAFEHVPNATIGSSDKRSCAFHRLPYLQSRKARLALIINVLYNLLKGVDESEWKMWLSGFPSLPRLIPRLQYLQQIAHHNSFVLDEADSFWESVAEDYQAIAEHFMVLSEAAVSC